ncbi:MAG: OstA-like protein [Flavobacterium sp.]
MNRFFYIFLLVFGFSFAQIPLNPNGSTNNSSNPEDPKKIYIEKADFFDVNQTEIPDAALLRGNIIAKHDGAVLYCNTAYYFKKENYIKCFGNVRLVQGDTITMTSEYGEYNGNNKLAYAQGNVVLTSPNSTLKTSLLHFDRATQEAYYRTGGTIYSEQNTLESITGTYYTNAKMFNFQQKVQVFNGSATINTDFLDYYEVNGHAYVKGPSTIKDKDTFIYTEKGFYDTKLDVSDMDKNSYILYKDRRIEGDFIYYDKKRDFSKATRNVKITDTVNNMIVTGHYGEMYQAKDSAIITKSALAKTLMENDTLYTHAQKMILSGKPESRVMRAYYNVRFYKSDMSGKCDSLYSDEKTSITQLIGNPVLWNFENQMTGDLMHLIHNKETEKLDSLKVFNNTFLVSKDTLGTGFNQVKGVFLNGRFEDNKLREVDVIKNTEIIYYLRNDNQEMIGINKSVCSKINMLVQGNTMEDITLMDQVEGEIYPEEELPENARKLRGFIWRQDERIQSVDDLMPEEEKSYDLKMKQEAREEKDKTTP